MKLTIFIAATALSILGVFILAAYAQERCPDGRCVDMSSDMKLYCGPCISSPYPPTPIIAPRPIADAPKGKYHMECRQIGMGDPTCMVPVPGYSSFMNLPNKFSDWHGYEDSTVETCPFMEGCEDCVDHHDGTKECWYDGQWTGYGVEKGNK